MFHVIRVQKTRDYTIISNHHLKNKELTLKAKGLMTLMLSLPEDRWEFSISGLTKLSKDGENAVRSALNELSEAGYFSRKIVHENGRIAGWEYTLTEFPVQDDENHQLVQDCDFQHLENQDIENMAQLNTKGNKKLIKSNSIPPTVEDVRNYCRERNNNIDAEQFVDFYESKGWKIGNSKMKDWRAAVRTWERRNAKPKKDTKFTSFEQRNYDYNTLEKQLLGR